MENEGSRPSSRRQAALALGYVFITFMMYSIFSSTIDVSAFQMEKGLVSYHQHILLLVGNLWVYVGLLITANAYYIAKRGLQRAKLPVVMHVVMLVLLSVPRLGPGGVMKSALSGGKTLVLTTAILSMIVHAATRYVLARRGNKRESVPARYAVALLTLVFIAGGLVLGIRAENVDRRNEAVEGVNKATSHVQAAGGTGRLATELSEASKAYDKVALVSETDESEVWKLNAEFTREFAVLQKELDTLTKPMLRPEFSEITKDTTRAELDGRMSLYVRAIMISEQKVRLAESQISRLKKTNYAKFNKDAAAKLNGPNRLQASVTGELEVLKSRADMTRILRDSWGTWTVEPDTGATLFETDEDLASFQKAVSAFLTASEKLQTLLSTGSPPTSGGKSTK